MVYNNSNSKKKEQKRRSNTKNNAQVNKYNNEDNRAICSPSKLN
jgi:hypothetical protein